MRPVAIDCETHLIRPGLLAPRLVSLAWTDGVREGLALRANGIWRLHKLLDDPEVLLVGHNIAYDFAVCGVADPSLIEKMFSAYAADRVEDTMVREMLLAIGRGDLADEGEFGKAVKFDLGTLVQQRLGFDISAQKQGPDIWRLRYSELDGVPIHQWPDAAREYALDDVRHTLAVYRHQHTDENPNVRDRAENPNPYGPPVDPYIIDSTAQARAAWCLHLMACWGIRTDTKRVLDYKAELEIQKKALDEQLIAEDLLRPVRKKGALHYQKNTKLLCELVEKYGGDDVPRTPNGKVSTKRDLLIELAESCDHPALATIGKRSGVEKILGTYMPTLLEGTQRPILPKWGVLVATGRTGCRNPTLQTLPRKGKTRECFAARPGYVFGSADYSYIELVTLAQTCLDWFGHSKMAEAINQDIDPHLRLGAQIKHLDEQEAIRRYAEGDKEVEDARQHAKCFHPDTQVLTQVGWKKILELLPGEAVAAAIPSDGGGIAIEWQVPTRVFATPGPGSLIHLRNEGIDLRVTDDHRMLAFCYVAKQRRLGTPKVVAPQALGTVRAWPNAGKCEAGGVEVDERLLRLAVAVQADGNYKPSGVIRLGFTKQRKIDRLRRMLAPFAGEYRETPVGKARVTTFYLSPDLSGRVGRLLTADKTLPWWWLQLKPELRRVVLNEVPHWDGHVGPKFRMYQYASTLVQNHDVLQAIATLEGRKTRLVWEHKKDENHAPCGRLSVKDHHLTRGENLQTTRVVYDGDVVCLSVPSTFVVVRDGGTPVIAGQCANFGYPGGLGAKRFVEYAKQSNIKISLDESKQLKENWYVTWPEMREFHAKIASMFDGRSYVQFEQPGSGRVRTVDRYTSAANSGFQGRAADGAKRAMFRIWTEMYTDRRSPLYGCRPVVFAHDEFILEMPEDRAADALPRLELVMVEGMREICPDVKVKTAGALMRHWYKGAKAVYDVNGRLIPWEPPLKKEQAA